MNLHINDFEGPLDLLLHLVRQSKMDLYSINISDIIEEYLSFIDSIPKEDIDKSSEYLVMSSELIHLKSRMLVNSKDEDEEDEVFSINSEEDLRNKLIEYEQYKNASELFKNLEENRHLYYTKLPESLREFTDEETVVNSDVSLDDLINAFLEMQKRIDLIKPISTKVTKKEYSVKERTIEIRNILKEKKKVNFIELFDIITKDNLVVTFLSLLDMSKNKELIIKQDKVFSDIIIESVK